MPRARSLKPGFFKNEELAELGCEGMCLFAGLWTLADREGRLEDRPRRIKAELFPYFDLDVDGLLTALVERGFLIRYEIDDARYIQVTHFSLHQSPHIKEAPSTIPAPVGHQTSTVLAPPDSPFPISDSPFSESIESLAGSRQRYPAPFEAFWTDYGPTNGPKKPAYTAWERLNEADRAAAIAALPAWQASVKWREGFKPYPQKYLNQRFWEASPAAGSAGASPENGRVIDLDEMARIDERLRELETAP